jgi:hypothetical protein
MRLQWRDCGHGSGGGGGSVEGVTGEERKGVSCGENGITLQGTGSQETGRVRRLPNSSLLVDVRLRGQEDCRGCGSGGGDGGGDGIGGGNP